MVGKGAVLLALSLPIAVVGGWLKTVEVKSPTVGGPCKSGWGVGKGTGSMVTVYVIVHGPVDELKLET